MKFIVKENGPLKDVAQKIISLSKDKIILFDGELGAGKTTLIKEIVCALSDLSHVTSPTFNKMNIYEKAVHIDAYNIKGSLEEFEDYFDDKLVLIEWGKNINDSNFNYLNVEIAIEKNSLKRIIKIINPKQ